MSLKIFFMNCEVYTIRIQLWMSEFSDMNTVFSSLIMRSIVDSIMVTVDFQFICHLHSYFKYQEAFNSLTESPI